ncbi:metallothiol transferase [Chlorella sorokiniana]|uniref:Metallothiol transferase n=1 Tax=Chlorella sorokiniana TaxID=3076 RepID=A0A2P6TTW1_CHLSO|nr:metallothiol transferase [Chlorella sorokiniana]|eukprot:PRW57501.1 metallothiol transferase [Chlorella sorokiniana]
MAACTVAGALQAHDVRSLQPPSLLALRGVNHISKVCSDVAKSVEFYRDVLGFIVVKRPQTFDETFEGCWLWRYGLGLHLIKGTPVPRSSVIDPKTDHLSFQADSLDGVQAALRSRGIPFVRQEVVEGGMLVEQLFFHDPDNNMIEVCNCDCIPIVPLEQWGRYPACTAGSAQDDEAMSELCTRDSLDSQRSEMEAEQLPPRCT